MSRTVTAHPSRRWLFETRQGWVVYWQFDLGTFVFVRGVRVTDVGCWHPVLLGYGGIGARRVYFGGRGLVNRVIEKEAAKPASRCPQCTSLKTSLALLLTDSSR